MPRRLLIAFCAATLALAGLPGCGRPVKKPNLVLIVVDTLRADALGCYGGPGGDTPNLDRLAAEGVQFRECLSQAPWTLPSVASILTGRLPSGHGANRLRRSVATSATLLPESLVLNGYESGGFLTNPFLKAGSGLDRGFDHWDTSLIGGADAITSEAVTDAAIRWVQDEDPQPFLMFLFYMDPHYAYMRQPGAVLPDYDGLVKPGQDIWELRDRLPHLGAEDYGYLRALYAGEVRAFDRAIGRLVRRLKEAGEYDNTFFLITSDHGEQLGERDWIGHTRYLNTEALDVPLLITGRKWLEPELRVDPAALIDVYPTILQLLGLAPMRLPGRGLFSPDRPERALYAEVTYDPQAIPTQPDPARNIRRTRELTKISDMRAVQKGRWKLIRNRLTDTWELYDRETDPGETRDLSGAHPAVVDALKASFPPPGSFEVPEGEAMQGITEDEIARLRNLGYVN